MKLQFYNPGFYIFHKCTLSLHGPGQMSMTITLNFKGLCVSINLHIIFLVLTTKTYLVLRFVVQYSKVLIPGKGLPSC
jgi:hypothetical protein